MPNLIPLYSIGVQRDGKNIHPKIGEKFNFTKEEVADLDALTTKTKVDYYRKPVNEDAQMVTDGDGDGTDAAAKTTGKKVKAADAL